MPQIHCQKIRGDILRISVHRNSLTLSRILLFPQEGLASSPVAEELWQSLEAEREAVLNFLFFTLDEALTPAQEAYLDINSYPWHPDIWAIVECLAERRKVSINLAANSATHSKNDSGMQVQRH